MNLLIYPFYREGLVLLLALTTDIISSSWSSLRLNFNFGQLFNGSFAIQLPLSLPSLTSLLALFVSWIGFFSVNISTFSSPRLLIWLSFYSVPSIWFPFSWCLFYCWGQRIFYTLLFILSIDRWLSFLLPFQNGTVSLLMPINTAVLTHRALVFCMSYLVTRETYHLGWLGESDYFLYILSTFNLLISFLGIYWEVWVWRVLLLAITAALIIRELLTLWSWLLLSLSVSLQCYCVLGQFWQGCLFNLLFELR